MNGQVLQLLMSLFEVALMVGLCALLFGRRDTPIVGPGAAAGPLARDVPGFRAGENAVGADARAALIENAANGDVYLVVARGDGLVARKLGPAVLRGTRRDGRRLVLLLADFTLRRAEIDLADADVAAHWETRLRALR